MSRHVESPYFPKSTPRTVEGGIRAKSARGNITSTWWTDATDEAEPPVPLTGLLDVFYVSPGKLPPPRPVASGASLLDQWPVVPLTVRGMPLAAALRPAFDALTARPQDQPG